MRSDRLANVGEGSSEREREWGEREKERERERGREGGREGEKERERDASNFLLNQHLTYIKYQT